MAASSFVRWVRSPLVASGWIVTHTKGDVATHRLEGSELRSGVWPAVTWLAGAWALIGFGDTLDKGLFSPTALVLVVAGTVMLTAVVVMGPARSPRISPWLLLFVLCATALIVPFYPRPPQGPSALSVVTVLLIGIAVVAVAWGWLTRDRISHTGWCFTVLLVVVGGAGITTILASPAPGNDVWYEYQAATQALFHGHDFYLTHWTSGLPGETSNVFNYLPASVVLLAPFHALLGDVRYGLLAAVLFAGWCAYRMGGNTFGWLCGGLVLLFPKGNFGIAMAWNDPLLLAGVAATALAVRRRRTGWAVFTFAVVLSTKQYAWLFVPLAARWEDFGWKRALGSASAAVAISSPWLIASPRAFWHGAVATFLNGKPSFGSLSLNTVGLHHGIDPGFIFLGCLVAASLGVAMLKPPRRCYGFLIRAGLVMAWFNLGSRQSFFNEWALVDGFIALAIAAALGARGDPLDRHAGRSGAEPASA